MLNKLIHWINRKDIHTLVVVTDALDRIAADTNLDAVVGKEIDLNVRLPLILMFARKRGDMRDLKGE